MSRYLSVRVEVEADDELADRDPRTFGERLADDVRSVLEDIDGIRVVHAATVVRRARPNP